MKNRAAEFMAQIGETGFIFKVDDCQKAVEELREKGLKIVSEPMKMPYGVSAIIADLYGE